jgi:hypothetical protein
VGDVGIGELAGGEFGLVLLELVDKDRLVLAGVVGGLGLGGMLPPPASATSPESFTTALIRWPSTPSSASRSISSKLPASAL